MPHSALLGIPDAIYFDTSVLRKVPYDLRSPEFQEVVAFAKRYNRDLIIPHVAWLEWTNYFRAQCESRCQSLHTDARYIGEVLGVAPPTIGTIPTGAQLSQAITSSHRERVVAAGITIDSMYEVEFQALLKDALSKEPPFETGGKGLCDAIILELVGSHASKTYAQPRVILMLSEDKAVLRSHRRLEKYGLAPVICTLSAASELLDAALTSAVRALNDRAKAVALQFLAHHKSEIFEFVSRASIRLKGLENHIEGYGRRIDSPRVTELLGSEPVAISTATPGFPLFREHESMGRYPFPFKVDVRFRVRIECLNLSGVFGGPTLSLDQPGKVDQTKRYSWLDPVQEEDEVTVPVHVDATVSLEGADEMKFKELQLIDAWL